MSFVQDRAQQITNVLGCLLPDPGNMPDALRAWFKSPNDSIDGATPLELLGTAEGVDTVAGLLARLRKEQESK